MAAAFQTWTVLPHGPLIEVDEDILTVVGEIKMPGGMLPRRMTLVRLADRRLIVFSAIALDEREMARVEAFGTPAFLIVPDSIHRQDAKIWHDRYPKAKVVAPEGARSKVEKVVPVDTMAPDFADPNVQFVAVPGTLEQDSALLITGKRGTTLVLNDLVGNIHGEKGFGGWLLRVMKFAGDEPHIPAPVKAKIVDSKVELREQLLAWGALPQLRRIIVSHGDIIESDPRGVLRTLADSLS
jgi:hypothetical protein